MVSFFRVQSGKNYTVQKKITRAAPVAPVTIMRYVYVYSQKVTKVVGSFFKIIIIIAIVYHGFTMCTLCTMVLLCVPFVPWFYNNRTRSTDWSDSGLVDRRQKINHSLSKSFK